MKLWLTFLDLLYPPRCGGCGAVGQGLWCEGCQKQVKLYRANEVKGELPMQAGEPLVVVSAAPFGPPLREAIHSFKYEGVPQMADLFGGLMRDAWRHSALSVDAFVPVPLHKRRFGERGFNQSELLAKQVSRSLNTRLEPRALQRIRYTSQQAHLTKEQRRQNVSGAFVADATHVRDKRLCVVDDVFTTGATLRECATALLQCGASDVYALTLTRA
jgi:competence protein ComFC